MQVNSVFTKGILTLITGNAVAFIVPVLLYPVLSRVFVPADYALFGLYFSIYGFLEIGSAGRYDFAIVMPQKDDDAANLVAGGFIISLLYAGAVLVLVLLMNEWVAEWLNNPRLASWLYFLPLGLISVSISKLFNSWLIRKKAFRASSVNKATQKFAESSAQLIFGFLKFGNGLILGDVTGRIFNAIVSYYQASRSEFKSSFISTTSIKETLKRYIEFPKYSILPSMLNTLGGMLPVFIIGSHYSIEESGSFNFSRIILSVPFALIASGISQVLMQQVSERRHKNESIYQDVSSLAKKLAILSVIGVLVLYFAGAELFEIVFGAKWRLSGEYTSILIFSYAVSFVVSPFSLLLVVLGKIRLVSFWQTFYFFAVCILWFISNFAIEHFLKVLVIIDVVAYGLYGLLIYLGVRDYEKGISK